MPINKKVDEHPKASKSDSRNDGNAIVYIKVQEIQIYQSSEESKEKAAEGKIIGTYTGSITTTSIKKQLMQATILPVAPPNKTTNQ